MPYSTCQRVAALIPNLLNGASNFDNLDATIVPGSAAFTDFMSSGCALINAKLNSLGYSAPVASTNGIYDILADIEANYVAFRAESARSSPRTARGERTRSDMFRRSYLSGLCDLGTMDLSRSGLGYTGKWAVTGISDAEKESVESDTDRVAPRFKREIFRNPDRTSSASS
jgi:hypothetical protein